MDNIRRKLKQVKISETLILWSLAIFLGLATGIGVWVFKELINLTYQALYGLLGSSLSTIGRWTLFILPVIGGLLVGAIIYFFVKEDVHSGVAGIMESVALAGGRLNYRRAPIRIIGSAISIGSGASVGPEDPSVQIGSYLGSLIGQKLGYSDDRMRALVAAGAASGISAAFNAPIAGVFFALEIILGEISGSALGVVMLAAVASAVFTQVVSGTQPAFQIPPYVYSINWQLPLYLVLGLFTGPLAAAYIRMIYLTRDIFTKLSRLPRWLTPALVGLLLGIVGLFLPQILGVGYATISGILNGSITAVGLLLILMAAKLILTPTSLAGGFIGGVIAPSLFIGAAAGEAFGLVSSMIFPSLGINPATFAMVGMAAVLAGSIHAPLTGILLLFEMTNDYHIILPAMFAVVVSQVLSQRIIHGSIYTTGLARMGIRLERGRDIEILETVLVSEVMQPVPFTLRDTDTLSQASQYFLETHHHGVPVVNAQDELVGIFTLQDLDAVTVENWSNLTVGDMSTHELLVAYPDETIGAALRRMGVRDIGRMPVVQRDNPRKLLGMLRRADLLRAYDAALTRRATSRHRIQQIRLGTFAPGDMQIQELLIEPGSICANRKINEISWPKDCIVASLRRGSQILIPHGDTLIKPGDVLVVVSQASSVDELTALSKTT